MNRIFIHNNNLCDDFENRILFSQNIELDKYISEVFLKEVEKKNPQIIFIKDALGNGELLDLQYIDLLGLRVAMHIRLSNSTLKLLSIVIVSELSLFSLVKLSPLAKILFTKNIFLVNNTKEAIENFDTTIIAPFNESEYKEKFLDLIEIEPPKDYLPRRHSIANEWSIYKWATALAVLSESTQKNKEKIHNMLYFKYLVAKDHIDIYNVEKLKTKFESGGEIVFKIVSIDDELDNGWRDIFKKIFKYQKQIQFKSLNYDYQDKSYWAIKTRVLKFINEENPDVVILDLRLAQNDHEKNINIEEISGIKLLQEIHNINAGIQVIMLTATSRSIILEKLYEYKILGYVKKEHPDDKMLNTQDNINKLIGLVDTGLNKSYLKNIWKIQQDILKLKIFNLNENISKQIEFEINNIFNILDSNLDKKITFFVLAVYNIIELIIRKYGYSHGKAYSSIIDICQNKLNINNLDKILSEIICTRNYVIHVDDEIQFRCRDNTLTEVKQVNMIKWLETIFNILKKIDI